MLEVLELVERCAGWGERNDALEPMTSNAAFNASDNVSTVVVGIRPLSASDSIGAVAPHNTM